MRYVLLAIACLVIGYVVKIDLQEGAITHTTFYETQVCEQQVERTVRIKLVEGDTIYSIFAATPSPIPMPFPERLAKFYELNPHLQKQTLIAGELIYVPIVENNKNRCKD
ncbi:MAG: hypothetical protein ABS949_06165 [Solibacillus sp.]